MFDVRILIRRVADEGDEALQNALRLSMMTSQTAECAVCTFVNEQATATECEMCGSSLTNTNTTTTTTSDSVPTEPTETNEDADLAFALRLAEEEKQLSASDDSLSQARSDPMWRARHGVVDRAALDRTLFGGNDAEEAEAAADGEYEEEEEIDPRAFGVEYITLKDGRIVTKHDPAINGRQNARNAEEHLPGMGDFSGVGKTNGVCHKEIRLPNTAYNAMKREMKKSMDGGVKKGVAQRGRVAAEQRATREGVLDLSTRKLLLKLINKVSCLRTQGGGGGRSAPLVHVAVVSLIFLLIIVFCRCFDGGRVRWRRSLAW